jgi:hypothetical protein
MNEARGKKEIQIMHGYQSRHRKQGVSRRGAAPAAVVAGAGPVPRTHLPRDPALKPGIGKKKKKKSAAVDQDTQIFN